MIIGTPFRPRRQQPPAEYGRAYDRDPIAWLARKRQIRGRKSVMARRIRRTQEEVIRTRKARGFFVAALALVGMLATVSAHAGDRTIVSTVISPPFALGAAKTWTSACIPVTPPIDVSAATVEAASLSVQRYVDRQCRQYPLDIATPLPTIPLKKNILCIAASYCGDQGTPDATPFAGIKVMLTDTSGGPNTVIALLLSMYGDELDDNMR